MTNLHSGLAVTSGTQKAPESEAWKEPERAGNVANKNEEAGRQPNAGTSKTAYNDAASPLENIVIEKEIERLMSEFGENSAEVPQIFTDEVRSYINLYRNNPRLRKFVESSLQRKARYMPMVRSIFQEKGIPVDMAYIAFIESGFNPQAVSRVGAVGLWQFMPATARDYSLRVNRSLDQRYDPVKATKAAADYFRDLLSIFGPRSFLLAMAAYNSGEGRIISCLKGIDDPLTQRNFWHIRSCLPKETRQFPPQIIAAAIIGSDPQRFGFDVNAQDEEPAVINADIGNDENQQGNIRLASFTVSREPVVESVKKTAVKHRSLVRHKRAVPQPLIYQVKRGNTLSMVAEAFGVRMSDIRKWNGMKKDKILSGQWLRIYPSKTIQMVRYTVKKGDTLSGIANRYRTNPTMIVLCNGINDASTIMVGQRIAFYARPKGKPMIYTVKKGSNLTWISEAFKVPVQKIMKWNGLYSTTIHPGQKLKIYAPLLRDI